MIRPQKLNSKYKYKWCNKFPSSYKYKIMEAFLRLDQSTKKRAEERRKSIQCRLMPDRKTKCPEGRQVVKLCINPECKSSLRCNNPKCPACGDKVHGEYCSSIQMEEAIRLYSIKAKKWTDMLMKAFENEDEIIEKIREGQTSFIKKFLAVQLKEAEMQSVRNLFSVHPANPLSGQKSYELLLKLQKELKFDMGGIEERAKQYSSAILPHIKEIESLRDKLFLSKEFKSSRLTQIIEAEEKDSDQKQLVQIEQEEGQIKNQAPKPVYVSKRAIRFFRQGYDFAQKGKFQEAVDCYLKSIVISPHYVKPHVNLGCVLNNLQRYEEAAHSFREAIRIDPNISICRNNFGFTLRKIGCLQEAIENYHKAIEINPNVPNAYENLRSLLLKEKMTVKQLETSALFLAKVLEKDPQHKRAKQAFISIQQECLKLKNKS